MNSSIVGGACEKLAPKKRRFPSGDLIPDAQLIDFIGGQDENRIYPTHQLFAEITKIRESYPTEPGTPVLGERSKVNDDCHYRT
jgi:hypothetical protein